MQKNKLHLNVKGNLRDTFYKWYAQNKAKKLGLRTHELNHHNSGNIEIVVVGKRTELENLVHWAKRGPFFSQIEEVRFKFLEIDIN